MRHWALSVQICDDAFLRHRALKGYSEFRFRSKITRTVPGVGLRNQDETACPLERLKGGLLVLVSLLLHLNGYPVLSSQSHLT